jgi:hypothetical protein
LGSVSRAELILAVSSDVGANVDFHGTGTGASFIFSNNQSGQGFTITQSNGFGDSVGLHGEIGGTFNYTTASIMSQGPLETAPVMTSGGSLTITDLSNQSLTANFTGLAVATMGTAGSVDVNGAVNLTNVSYSGMNTDLLALRNEAQADGGIVAISFQFVPSESLTQLAAAGSDMKTSYSGTITAVPIPEPAGATLGCIALGTVILGLKWRRSRRARAKLASRR